MDKKGDDAALKGIVLDSYCDCFFLTFFMVLMKYVIVMEYKNKMFLILNLLAVRISMIVF